MNWLVKISQFDFRGIEALIGQYIKQPNPGMLQRVVPQLQSLGQAEACGTIEQMMTQAQPQDVEHLNLLKTELACGAPLDLSNPETAVQETDINNPTQPDTLEIGTME